MFGDKLYFKDIKFPLKIKDIHEIVFDYEKKVNIKTLCQKKFFEEKNVDLFLIREKGKTCYVVIKDFNTLSMIICYIVEENISIVTVYKLLVQNNIKVSR